MPRYRFEYLEEPDVEPIYADFAGPELAIVEAHQAVLDAAHDCLDKPWIRTVVIAVYSDGGELLATVTAKLDAS